jgi:hypothetical protein
MVKNFAAALRPAELAGISVYSRYEMCTGQQRVAKDRPVMQRLAALVFAFAAGLCAAGDGFARDAATATLKRAESLDETITRDALHIADWAVRSADHQGLPFIIVDKLYAKAYAFDASGRLLASTPVLIGMGVGDTFAPGVLKMSMHQTTPSQRITPAGRFFAEEDRNLKGQRVLWVDYEAGIAIHKLSPKKTSQRRHERMASPYPADHRITFGCINVPPAFYEEVVARHFRRRGGIVYILPDQAPLSAFFRSHDAGSAVAQAPAQVGGGHVIPTAARKF